MAIRPRGGRKELVEQLDRNGHAHSIGLTQDAEEDSIVSIVASIEHIAQAAFAASCGHDFG